MRLLSTPGWCALSNHSDSFEGLRRRVIKVSLLADFRKLESERRIWWGLAKEQIVMEYALIMQ